MSELKDINNCIKGCNKCNISPNRGYGYGNINSDIMFIAQNPGWQPNSNNDDIIPFGLNEDGGKNSGKYFVRFLEHFNIHLDEFYITNIIKCPTIGNRPPSSSEVRNCIGFLEREIQLQNPKLIILLGGCSKKYFWEYYDNFNIESGVMIEDIWHPAYIYRFKSEKLFNEWIEKAETIGIEEYVK
jgi:DNA polymerase